MLLETRRKREYNARRSDIGLKTGKKEWNVTNTAIAKRPRSYRVFHTAAGFIKKNAVAVIAFAAAAATSFIIPPDDVYISYIDLKTLSCLLCVLAVVCALRRLRFFYALAHGVVRLFRNMRACSLAVVYVTFIGSMLIANDMALLTFLPLGYNVLKTCGMEKYTSKLFILQTIAANLGGMLTPFGNPQNLYLYGKFNIPESEFISVMAPPFLISMLLFTVCCVLFFKPEPLAVPEERIILPKMKTARLLVLFAVSIIMVFRVIPYYLGLAAVVIALLFIDKSAFADVDWALLLTFVFFFIFAGNMSRIGAVRELISSLLAKNTLLVSAASCQVISNVPSAILLSQFTGNYRELLVGVNVGGTGTLIASLASLITFREYVRHDPSGGVKYLLEYSAFSFAFLAILLAFESLIL